MSFEAARTVVRRAWAETLGASQAAIADDDDFFVLGGHSLLVLQVVDVVEQAACIPIPLEFFFEHPRLDDLARYVSSAG